MNEIFLLSFESEAQRKGYKRYYLPIEEIKNYNAIIDEQNVFDQPIRNILIEYDSIPKIATGQGNDYTTSYLLDYNYFKNHYKMIAIDLGKQQTSDAAPVSIQPVNFTGNLNQAANATMLCIIEEAQKNCFVFFRRNCKSILILLFALI